MAELALILVSTVLVNNFVLVKFLGLCPFMGVSRKLETAAGMALASRPWMSIATSTESWPWHSALLSVIAPPVPPAPG